MLGLIRIIATLLLFQSIGSSASSLDDLPQEYKKIMWNMTPSVRPEPKFTHGKEYHRLAYIVPQKVRPRSKPTGTDGDGRGRPKRDQAIYITHEYADSYFGIFYNDAEWRTCSSGGCRVGYGWFDETDLKIIDPKKPLTWEHKVSNGVGADKSHNLSSSPQSDSSASSLDDLPQEYKKIMWNMTPSVGRSPQDGWGNLYDYDEFHRLAFIIPQMVWPKGKPSGDSGSGRADRDQAIYITHRFRNSYYAIFYSDAGWRTCGPRCKVGHGWFDGKDLRIVDPENKNTWKHKVVAGRVIVQPKFIFSRQRMGFAHKHTSLYSAPNLLPGGKLIEVPEGSKLKFLSQDSSTGAHYVEYNSKRGWIPKGTIVIVDNMTSYEAYTVKPAKRVNEDGFIKERAAVEVLGENPTWFVVKENNNKVSLVYRNTTKSSAELENKYSKLKSQKLFFWWLFALVFLGYTAAMFVLPTLRYRMDHLGAYIFSAGNKYIFGLLILSASVVVYKLFSGVEAVSWSELADPETTPGFGFLTVLALPGVAAFPFFIYVAWQWFNLRVNSIKDARVIKRNIRNVNYTVKIVDDISPRDTAHAKEFGGIKGKMAEERLKNIADVFEASKRAYEETVEMHKARIDSELSRRQK